MHACACICPRSLPLHGALPQVLWWGFTCFPAARLAVVTLYYSCGALSVWAALRAQTAAGRGLPLLALLLVRLAAFCARLALEGWAGAPALRHYFAMEVGAGALPGAGCAGSCSSLRLDPHPVLPGNS